ncbi:hypothetical protein KGQ31_00625 [Patescibacteria group bacterium]|nr:hypothetical protein [Patescibacteria group bacterium]
MINACRHKHLWSTSVLKWLARLEVVKIEIELFYQLHVVRNLEILGKQKSIGEINHCFRGEISFPALPTKGMFLYFGEGFDPEIAFKIDDVHGGISQNGICRYKVEGLVVVQSSGDCGDDVEEKADAIQQATDDTKVFLEYGFKPEKGYLPTYYIILPNGAAKKSEVLNLPTL